MANIFSTISPDYKKIIIYSDDFDMNENFPVLIHSIDGKTYKIYTKDNSTQIIDAEEFDPSDNVQELNFELKSSSWGDLNVFEINSYITGDTSLEDLIKLKNGIHSFMFLSQTSLQTFLEIGKHVKDDIDCCIAKKIDKANSSTDCSLENVIKDVQKVFAINESIDASIKAKEFINAIQKRKLNLTICNSNCKCGCN